MEVVDDTEQRLQNILHDIEQAIKQEEVAEQRLSEVRFMYCSLY